jgi:probable phosphoglycerate mutase
MVAPSPAVSAEEFHQERWIPPAGSTELLLVRHGASAAGPDAAGVVVTHGAFIAEVCRQATDSRPFAFLNVDNASITRLAVLPGGRRVLLALNDTAHLQ